MRGVILKYAVVFSLVLGSGGLLMNVSQHVQRAEREMKSYEHKISTQEEAIRVLRAEWAYLNNPARLEFLASKGLGFVSPDANGLVSNASFLEHKFNSPVFVPVRNPSLQYNISYAPSSRTTSHQYKPYFSDYKYGGDR